MESIKEIDETGVIIYRNTDGFAHREDGPAIIKPEDSIAWCINGDFHREDGPAIIDSKFGNAYWFKGIRYSYEDWLKLIPNPIMIKWREFCESN